MFGLRWPGQVWDAAKATKQQLRIRRAGQLVVFFGDNSFGWFPRELLVDFAEHLEDKAKQKTGNKVRSRPFVTGKQVDRKRRSCRERGPNYKYGWDLHAEGGTRPGSTLS